MRVRLLYFLLFRLVCIAFSYTWFVPDEVFQSVEVAYRMVYGIGFRTWEWSSEWALRSSLHPSLFASIFWSFRALHIDYGFVIRWAPNILHAVLFAFADLCYLKWLQRLGLNYDAQRSSILLYIFNWFILYCSARTLSNTLECCFSIIAMYFYSNNNNNNSLCVAFASIATILRPTSALLWAPLIIQYIWQHFTSELSFEPYNTACFMLRLASFGFAPLICSIMFDSLYYGYPVLCMWNFVLFNVFQGGSAHFGAHHWSWYFTQGLPALLTIACIPLITSCFHLNRFQHLKKRYAIVAFIYIVGHSFIDHKEHRFLLPVLAFLFPYIAQEISSYRVRRKNQFIYGYIALNVLLSVYFGLIHQRGPTAVNERLLEIINEWKSKENIKILQLMPCFSLPQYAHLHPYGNKTNIKMLDCSPKLRQATSEEDEADKFHSDPEEWLNREWYSGKLFDAHIVIAFDRTYGKIERFLTQKGFKRKYKIFHTHFLSSSRQSPWFVISVRKF